MEAGLPSALKRRNDSGVGTNGVVEGRFEQEVCRLLPGEDATDVESR